MIGYHNDAVATAAGNSCAGVTPLTLPLAATTGMRDSNGNATPSSRVATTTGGSQPPAGSALLFPVAAAAAAAVVPHASRLPTGATYTDRDSSYRVIAQPLSVAATAGIAKPTCKLLAALATRTGTAGAGGRAAGSSASSDGAAPVALAAALALNDATSLPATAAYTYSSAPPPGPAGMYTPGVSTTLLVLVLPLPLLPPLPPDCSRRLPHALLPGAMGVPAGSTAGGSGARPVAGEENTEAAAAVSTPPRPAFPHASAAAAVATVPLSPATRFTPAATAATRTRTTAPGAPPPTVTVTRPGRECSMPAAPSLAYAAVPR